MRVVELASWVAGPSACGLLADWGADVIKVEPPTGDPLRGVFGAIGHDAQDSVPQFELDNRGKRSVVLDLDDEADLDALHGLLAEADVLVTSMRLEPLTQRGLDPASIRSRHPRLVYGIVTGYGLDGPDVDRPGYDVGAFWARSGLAAAIAPKGSLPPTIRPGFGDHVTGMTLAAGVCAALVDRQRTGQGHLVSTSLLRTGTYCHGWDLSVLLRFGRLASARPREESPTPLINCYAASDGLGFWLLGVEGDRHWPALARAIGDESISTDSRFQTARDRARNAADVIAALDATFAQRTMAEWVKRFDEHGVWWAPLNTSRTLLDDPQVIASGAVVEAAGNEGTRAPATPVDFDGRQMVAAPTPAIGEHSDQVRATRSWPERAGRKLG